MRKWSLGTIRFLIRNDVCTSAWCRLPMGLCYCPYWGVFHNPVEKKNSLGAGCLKVMPSNAMVWVWLKRISFNVADFWTACYGRKSLSGGITFLMGYSCWEAIWSRTELSFVSLQNHFPLYPGCVAHQVEDCETKVVTIIPACALWARILWRNITGIFL